MPNLEPASGNADERADAAASFDPLRRTLIRVAYRMLGSVADAEDIVQDAFIRGWQAGIRLRTRDAGAYIPRRAVRDTCVEARAGRVHQRAAGFRHAGSRRRAADDRARDRRREDRRDLCRAQS
ncbi:hypothetical protein CFB89_00050 [Burkholderia sp. AU16741]|nr:hypothetical protein CFB89_00050 [Burkholderia sp. AU16741]